MDIDSILDELKRERDRIDGAIAALENVNRKRGGLRRHAGRARRRKLTPEGRKRLSEMMKKRWAERKRRAKVA